MNTLEGILRLFLDFLLFVYFCSWNGIFSKVLVTFRSDEEPAEIIYYGYSPWEFSKLNLEMFKLKCS